MTERWQRELARLREIEPPAGLRDRVLGGLADPGQRLVPGRSRRRLRASPVRALSAIGAAAAVVAVAVAVGVISQESRVRLPGGDIHGGIFTDPQFGWTIKYPHTLRVRHIHAGFRWPLDGVRITSFAPDLGKPTGTEPETGWLREFPADGVAAQIWYLGVPSPFTPAVTTGLPLRRADFGQARRYSGGTEPAPKYRTFTADGFRFNAAVWIGKDAKEVARRAIWAAVASLRFPALRSGTIFSSDVYVLGRAASYPVGSVTFYSAQALPRGQRLPHPRGFYLVRGRSAFYVIEQRFTARVSPYASCQLSYDRAAGEFFCPGTALRWGLAGQPLAGHAHQLRRWSLSERTAVLATDGHVLYGPSFGQLSLSLDGAQFVR